MYLCVTGHSRNPAFKDMYHGKFDHMCSASFRLWYSIIYHVAQKTTAWRLLLNSYK